MVDHNQMRGFNATVFFLYIYGSHGDVTLVVVSVTLSHGKALLFSMKVTMTAILSLCCCPIYEEIVFMRLKNPRGISKLQEHAEPAGER